MDDKNNDKFNLKKMYQVEMQFIPGNNIAWVLRLKDEDPIYMYESEIDAQNMAVELERDDITGRKYRVRKPL